MKPRALVDIPENFKLERYRSASDLSAFDWGRQFALRSYLWSCVGVYDPETYVYNPALISAEIINEVLDDPLETAVFTYFGSSSFFERPAAAVKPLSTDSSFSTVGELLIRRGKTPVFARRILRFFMNDPLRSDQDPADWPPSMKRLGSVHTDHVCGPRQRLSVEIDLACSDEQISKETVQFVRAMRSERGLATPPACPAKSPSYLDPQDPDQVSPDLLEKWLKFQVLPWLDLNLFARSHGREMHQGALGNALWPHEIHDAVSLSERAGKTAKKWALKAIHKNFLSTFWAEINQNSA